MLWSGLRAGNSLFGQGAWGKLTDTDICRCSDARLVAAQLQRHLQRVARGAGLRGHDGRRPAGQRVEQAALTGVWAAQQRHAHAGTHQLPAPACTMKLHGLSDLGFGVGAVQQRYAPQAA